MSTTSRVVLPQRCYQGVIPSAIATASAQGIPNVTYVSQVFYLDETHVALSCQFFNKTKQNVLENPYASVQVYDPVSFDAYELDLRYDHSEESGALFDAMALRIEAIASHTGMKGVFRLIAADVYEVLSSRPLLAALAPPSEAAKPEDLAASARSELRGLQLVSQVTCQAWDLAALLPAVLRTLDEALGFGHSMILLAGEDGERLQIAASHGYPVDACGGHVQLGEGLLGAVARERRVLRVSGVSAELRYGRAIRATVEQSGARRELQPEIPLFGLPDAQSHLGLPLAVGQRFVGVLAVESKKELAFDEWHEAFLEVVANQVAVAIDNALLRGGGAGRDDSPSQTSAQPSLRFRFFRNDDCVFLGDDYLIRNVPGRILWKILRAYVDSGRTEFSNRELRLDPWLGLPALRDNLESRLTLLRKRLAERCPELRLVSAQRGQFRLECSRVIELEER